MTSSDLIVDYPFYVIIYLLYLLNEVWIKMMFYRFELDWTSVTENRIFFFVKKSESSES